MSAKTVAAFLRALTTTGLLLSTAVLATGCGGGGSDTMRATLTDDGCTYEGDTTPAPGSFDIEVANKTSHFVAFTLSELPAGKTAEDVRHAVERKAGPGIPMSGAGGARTRPHETKVIHVNEYSGRFVIGCWVHKSADALYSVNPGRPAALYVVPVEIEVR